MHSVDLCGIERWVTKRLVYEGYPLPSTPIELGDATDSLYGPAMNLHNK